ncbi:MAG: TonB-dependent receptor [Acidobacteriaceae bacterium]|nr:TonB-dependent receptor [Acidobacteriaceae bacterium]
MTSGFANEFAKDWPLCGPTAPRSSILSPVVVRALMLVVVGCAPMAAADLSLPVTGNLLGSVMDAVGTPQMGATVQILNKYEHLVAKAITTPDGHFIFSGLPVDSYSIRVTQNSFLPASRDRIAVKAGLDSILQIHLATLFSSIELRYSVPGAAMSDDWRWVLRSSPATRMITRAVDPSATSSSEGKRAPVFSETKAMLMLSGGDGGAVDTDSIQGDLGTGFAVSTNVLGKNQLELGGSLGQNANVGPAAIGLFAAYRATGGQLAQPEITLSFTQLGLLAPQFAGGPVNLPTPLTGGAPAIRSIATSFYEATEVGDLARIEYGMTAQSVDYLQHRSLLSPFGRVSVPVGSNGHLLASYSAGARPDALLSHDSEAQTAAEGDRAKDATLTDTMNTLSRLPQISNRDGRLQLQKTQTYEAGYQLSAGSRTYAVSAFYDDVRNGRVNVAGDVSGLDSTDLLWDGTSETATYNIGNYSRKGYLASVDQRVGSDLRVSAAFGRMGGFSVDQSTPTVSGGGRSFLSEQTRNIAAVNIQARVPRSKTKISADYGWMDPGTVVPRHYFTTQNTYMDPGLNVYIRQPLPSFGMPGHFEFTADVRNLLAQGYLPVNSPSGRLLIVQSPRALRGGVNFIF